MRYLVALTAACLLPCLLTPGAVAADWKIQLSGHGLTRGQAPDPADAEYRFPLQQQILLDDKGHYRNERRTTFPGDITFHFLEVGGPEGKKTVDIAGWRTGTETDIEGPDSARIGYADMLMLSPTLLLRQGRAASAVNAKGGQSLKDPAGRTVQLKFDANHNVIEAEVDGQRYLYADWTDKGGLRQPAKVTVLRGDRLLRELTQVRLEQTRTTPADWQIPTGYTTSFARDGLHIVQVAGDLYRLEGSPSTYHMAFAVGSKGIVLFDTPRSKEEGEAMRRQISAAFPGKTVTDIVYSHGHIDHQAGLSAWLDLNPQIWTGAGGRMALLRNVPGTEKLRVQEITTERDLTLAGLTFRMLPVRSPHAHDMLVALFPAAGAVLQGDLFMVPNQGPAAAYPTAAHLQQVLHKAGFSAKHIISVHGRVATANELAQSVGLYEAQHGGQTKEQDHSTADAH